MRDALLTFLKDIKYESIIVSDENIFQIYT